MAAASLRAYRLGSIALGAFSGDADRLLGAMKSRDILPVGLDRLSSVQSVLIGANNVRSEDRGLSGGVR